MVERYYNEDKSAIAVLVSRDYGAGWSTWNEQEGGEPYQIAFDKRVVEFWLEHKDDKHYIEELDRFDFFEANPIKSEARAYFESLGYSNVYFGGFLDIELKWVPIGAHFEIKEDDGAESLYILDLSDFAVA